MSRHRIAALLVSLPVVVLAQGQDGGGNAPPLPPEPPRPAVAAPTEAPPPAPASGAATAPSSYVPPGRWVHTAQYGWVWMPWPARHCRSWWAGWASDTRR